MESLLLKMLQLVLGNLHHFYENTFTLSRVHGFSGKFKTSSQGEVHLLFGKFRKMLRISDTISHFIFYDTFIASGQISFVI